MRLPEADRVRHFLELYLAEFNSEMDVGFLRGKAAEYVEPPEFEALCQQNQGSDRKSVATRGRIE